jgi:hypothetical protein
MITGANAGLFPNGGGTSVHIASARFSGLKGSWKAISMPVDIDTDMAYKAPRLFDNRKQRSPAAGPATVLLFRLS